MHENEAVEHIAHQGKLLSIIIRTHFEKDGIDFFTPADFSQQLAYMKRVLPASVLGTGRGGVI